MTSAADSDPHALERNDEAKVWMKRGMALLSTNDAAAMPEALNCFEKALEIRCGLPFEQSAWFRWLLTACWMNRGDVLTRLGGAQELVEAVRSFDEAIFHLERLPLEADPQYRSRLALGWMNRGLALRAQGAPESMALALESLERSKKVLEESVAAGQSANRTMLATLAMNRAALLLELTPPRMVGAMDAAQEALQACRPTEDANLLAAEIGLKARHVFCHAVALLLETPQADATRADEWIMRATDGVEEAMHLTALWERRGVTEPFRALRYQLFRYGCSMYLAYQPHFLAEFLLDVLDPERGSPLLARAEDLYQAGLESLDLAAKVLRQRGPLDLGPQGVDRLLEVLEELNQAAERIKKLSERLVEG